MMTMVMSMVVVAVRVPVAAVRTMRMISASGRLERLLDITDISAEPLQHGPDHMIPQDQDAAFLDLGRKMPVAEMPGKFDEMQRIARLDLEKFFRRSLHLDRIAIVEHQPVAMVKEHCLFQVEHQHVPVRQMQELATQMTQVMRQADGIDRRIGNLAGGTIGMDMLHEG